MKRNAILIVALALLMSYTFGADTNVVKIDTDPYTWVAVVAFLSTFYCAWGGGANDCANSFSSTVGSGAITLKHAVIMAAIFEMAGVMLMGSHVSDTVRKKIIDINMFLDEPALLMFGMFCSILSAGIWLMVATWMEWAVSTTHTIIGSILGFGIAAKGMDAVVWSGVTKIVVSWVLSPGISGIISAIFFVGIRNGILRKDNSPTRLINFYPILILVSIGIYSMFIIYKGSPQLKLNKTPLWLSAVISTAIGAFFAIISKVLYVPYLFKQLESDKKNNTNQTEEVKPIQLTDAEGQVSKKQIESEKQIAALHDNAEKFDINAENVCKHLQVFTACCDTFAHGANDVANSIGPFAAVMAIYNTGYAEQKSDIPIWILFLGGIGLVIGLATWGYKIIDRMGRQMTKITPSRGACIELGSTAAVIIASRLGLPVSTTHCQVGSVFAVGLLDGVKNVNGKILLYTVFSWIATLPAAGLCCAAFYLFGVKSPSPNQA